MDIDKMTIREVMEATRDMPIREGGLKFMIEKIVKCIEELKEKINETEST